MVLIELFDKTPLENIITSLALHPERVIFVGPDVRKAYRVIPDYQKLFAGRGVTIEFSARGVAKNDLWGTLSVLRDITSDEGEKYVIDISGGDETALVAAGMLLRERGDDNVSLFRINEISGRGASFHAKPMKKTKDVNIKRSVSSFRWGDVYLSNEESVVLHGGRIVECGIAFGLGDPEAADVEKLWRLCRADCGAWNANVGKLSASISRYSENGHVYLLADNAVGQKNTQLPRTFWNKLVKNGLVEIKTGEGGRGGILFTFKSKLVRECLTKAGSVLEYYVYKIALETKEKGVPVFQSANSGVVIGWDERTDGTRNEIDVMLMHGVTPIFISCKNGSVKTDELYKLETVSRKFGSRHAKSALASTVYFDMEHKHYGGKSETENIKKRAEVMEVRIISSIHKMTAEQLKKELIKLVK